METTDGCPYQHVRWSRKWPHGDLSIHSHYTTVRCNTCINQSDLSGMACVWVGARWCIVEHFSLCASIISLRSDDEHATTIRFITITIFRLHFPFHMFSLSSLRPLCRVVVSSMLSLPLYFHRIRDAFLLDLVNCCKHCTRERNLCSKYDKLNIRTLYL